MQWAASGQSQLTGWERGAKVLTEVMAAAQSVRKAAGGSGGVEVPPSSHAASTCSPCTAAQSLVHRARLLQTQQGHSPCAAGAPAAGNGGCRPIGNGGLLILLPGFSAVYYLVFFLSCSSARRAHFLLCVGICSYSRWAEFNKKYHIFAACDLSYSATSAVALMIVTFPQFPN